MDSNINPGLPIRTVRSLKSTAYGGRLLREDSDFVAAARSILDVRYCAH